MQIMPQNTVHHISFHWELAYNILPLRNELCKPNQQKNIVIYFWLCSVIKKNTTKNLCSIEGKATFIIELIFHQNAALYEKR